jgi:hypothetical protein
MTGVGQGARVAENSMFCGAKLDVFCVPSDLHAPMEALRGTDAVVHCPSCCVEAENCCGGSRNTLTDPVPDRSGEAPLPI